MKWLMGIFSSLAQWLGLTKTTSSIPQEHVDFILGEYILGGDDAPPISTVKLLTGPFVGVEYCYMNVRVSEHAGAAQLSFKYSFLDTAQYSHAALKNNAAFVSVAGKILESLLLREGGMNDTVGSGDHQESDL